MIKTVLWQNASILSGYLLELYIFSLAVTSSMTVSNHPDWNFRIYILVIAVLVSLIVPKSNKVSVSKSTLLFVLTACLTGLANPESEAINYSLRYLAEWSLLYIVVAEVTVQQRGWKQLNNALMGLVALICFQLLLQVWIAPSANATEWVKSAEIPIIVVPNDLILLACLSAFLGLSVRDSNVRVIQITGLSLMILSLVICVLYDTRSGVATYSITLLVFYSLEKNFKKLMQYGSIFIVVIIWSDAINHFQLWQKIHLANLQNRPALWWTAWQMFIEAPLLGQGHGSFLSYYQFYKETNQFPEWMPIVDMRSMPWAHNLYLELLAERGLIGFVLFVLIVVECFCKLWKCVNTFSLHRHSKSITLIAALTGMLIAGLVELTLSHYWVGLLLSIILAVTSNLVVNSEESIRAKPNNC